MNRTAMACGLAALASASGVQAAPQVEQCEAAINFVTRVLVSAASHPCGARQAERHGSKEES